MIEVIYDCNSLIVRYTKILRIDERNWAFMAFDVFLALGLRLGLKITPLVMKTCLRF